MVTTSDALRSLYLDGPVLTLVNVWDADSARQVEQAGAIITATASASIAASRGYRDGEDMPAEVALAALAQIVSATSLPVTADLEAGYGDARTTVRKAAAMGVVGANVEDVLRPLDASVRLMEDALAGAADEGVDLVLNARTDAFLLGEEPLERRVDNAIERGRAYLEAGATCVFVPGAPDDVVPTLVREIGWRRVSLYATPASRHPQEWASAGVARVSYGPSLYRLPEAERADFIARTLAVE